MEYRLIKQLVKEERLRKALATWPLGYSAFRLKIGMQEVTGQRNISPTP